jgi:spoIIIJ-associated protein
MTDRKFFSGNSLDQAIAKAAQHFDIPAEELAYQPIEKKRGFLRGRRSVVIEVSLGSPRRTLSDDEALEKARAIEPEAQASEAVETAAAEEIDEPEKSEAAAGVAAVEGVEDASEAAEVADVSGEVAPKMVELPESAPKTRESLPEAEGDKAKAASEAVQILLELAGAEMESSVHEGEERLEIELWGADEDVLLKSQGRPLLAIQHLAPRLIRGLTGESVFCRVDCDSFHMIREERLRDLAQRVASEVSDRGRSRMLESMAPDERRIVHMTLADDPNVFTESQGNGFLKRIKVLPA